MEGVADFRKENGQGLADLRHQIGLSVLKPAAVVGRNHSGVYWEATLGAQGVLTVHVSGAIEYDSFCSYALSLSSATAASIELADVQLELPMAKVRRVPSVDIARFASSRRR